MYVCWVVTGREGVEFIEIASLKSRRKEEKVGGLFIEK